MRKDTCIYADYQATTPVDPRVLAAMEPYWNKSFGNPHSSDHIVGWRAEKATREAATSVAGLIGADADEVIFTSGATEANNLALLGLARHSSNRRRRILVSAIEHKCVLAAARSLSEREGLTVETVPVDSKGYVELGALREMLDDDVLVVSIIAVNNEIGVIQNIPRIASVLVDHGILLHCDAAQAPCAMDLSLLAEHADLASLSGHKMYGPRESEPCISGENYIAELSHSSMEADNRRAYGPARFRYHFAWEWGSLPRYAHPKKRSGSVSG